MKSETLTGILLDERTELSLHEFCDACSSSTDWVVELVEERSRREASVATLRRGPPFISLSGTAWSHHDDVVERLLQLVGLILRVFPRPHDVLAQRGVHLWHELWREVDHPLIHQDAARAVPRLHDGAHARGLVGGALVQQVSPNLRHKRKVAVHAVDMIEPMKGRMYEPCCGSGSFMVHSERFLDHHAGRREDLAIYGQELNHTTYGLARMNLAIRGIVARIEWNDQGTLLRDAFPDEKFDFAMANPPFNISDWGGGILAEDRRWTFGTPPVGNANFAWMQHIYDKLGSTGIAGVVMANGSMSSMSSGEGDIRRAMVEGGAVDAMVALPGQLFYGTQIPACVWILAKDKSNGIAKDAKLRDRRGEVLFIDARKMGALVTGSRKQKELSQEEIARIAAAYHAWRGEPDAGTYEDEPGFCKAASLEEITKHNFVLTPGRYVGAGAAEEDDEPFEEKFERLKAELRGQFVEGRRLEAEIEARLEMLE